MRQHTKTTRTLAAAVLTLAALRALDVSARGRAVAAINAGVLVATGPNRDMVEKVLAKTPVASPLRSAEWADVPLALRERAQFSAGVESVRILAEIQSKIEAAVKQAHDGTFMNKDRFIAEMRDVARGEGFPVSEQGGYGALTDITSVKRLGLIWEMQNQQAAGFAQWKAGQDPDVLDAYPAQELIRVESRNVPRDWQERWKAAGGKLSEGGRMIALKTDGIWQRLSAFGTPWPPFDWGSGMGLMDVSREEAEQFGVLAPGKPVEPSEAQFNDDLQASVKDWRPDQVSTLKLAFGDQVAERDEKLQWQGNLIGDLVRDVQDFVIDRPFDNRAFKGRRVDFGAATSRVINLAAESMDLEGMRMILRPDDVVKILRSHGEEGTESPRGQRPIRKLDLETLPHVWRDPDSIEAGKKNRSLLFRKHILGQIFTVEWQMDANARVMYPNTMWAMGQK